MNIESHISTAISPSRHIENARPYELTAYNDIKQYISETDDEVMERRVGAYWLADINQQTKYIAVMIAIESRPGTNNYIALPQRLFGADVDEYVFGGSFIAGNGGVDAFATIGSTGSKTHIGALLSDIIIFRQGVLDEVLVFDGKTTSYKTAYNAT